MEVRSLLSFHVEDSDAEAKPKPGLSPLMAVASSSKTILGAGILSLSWAFFHSTMWPGIAITVFMCLLSAYNFYLLGVLSDMTGYKTYGEMWRHCYGEGLTRVPNFLILVACFLANTSYTIIIGDYLPRALAGLGFDWAPLQDRSVVIILATLVIGPLNYLKDLSFLGYFSMVGTSGALYTCMVLFYESLTLPSTDSWESLRMGPGLFIMVPTVSFAFNGHFNAADIYQQLKSRSPRLWLMVTVCTFSFCLMVVLICAISGYFLFGHDLALEGRSNVLNAPAFQSRTEIMVAYFATCFSVSISIPLHSLVARDALELLWLHGRPPSYGVVGDNALRRTALTTLYLSAQVSLALVVRELGLISAISGAVCASLIMFIFPSMMYLKSRPRATQAPSMMDAIVHRWFPCCSIFLGTVIGVTGVLTSAASGFDFF